MRTPTIHLNGTSGEDLLEQVQTAYKAFDEARRALSKAAPNDRDYYMQEGSSCTEAQAEHRERAEKIRSVKNDLRAIAHAIYEQVDKE